MKSLLISLMALALCRATGSENESAGGGSQQTGTGNTGTDQSSATANNTGAMDQPAGNRSPADANVEGYAAGEATRTAGGAAVDGADEFQKQSGTVSSEGAE